MWEEKVSRSPGEAVLVSGRISETPDFSEITTGTPNCVASRATRPKGSEVEGRQQTSAME